MVNFFDIRSALSGRFWAVMFRPFLGFAGKNIRIINPLKFRMLNRIFIHNNVMINALGWIQVHDNDGSLVIGEGTVLGHHNHIYAFKKIGIGKKVLTADKVYISDCLHGYQDIDTAIMDQPVTALPPVSIGDHTWLGENVVVLGASIGRHCVIGSNSVVTKDIPDYSIAVGSPAKVIRTYSHEKKEWVRV